MPRMFDKTRKVFTRATPCVSVVFAVESWMSVCLSLCLSVCLCVCLTHASRPIVSKRLNLS